MNIYYALIASFILLAVVGCSSFEKVEGYRSYYLYKGAYYSVGDRDCVKFKEHPRRFKVIECFNDKDQYVEMRDSRGYEQVARKRNSNSNYDYAQSMRTLSNLGKSINSQANSVSSLSNKPNYWQNNNINSYTPTKFYSPSDCYGSIVNGQCMGRLKPTAKPKYCHGRIVNNQCQGTVTRY